LVHLDTEKAPDEMRLLEIKQSANRRSRELLKSDKSHLPKNIMKKKPYPKTPVKTPNLLVKYRMLS
jgi:hypothetical protein